VNQSLRNLDLAASGPSGQVPRLSPENARSGEKISCACPDG